MKLIRVGYINILREIIENNYPFPPEFGRPKASTFRSRGVPERLDALLAKSLVTDGVRFEIMVRLIPSTISSLSSEMPRILTFTQTLHGITAVFIHELAVITRQLDSVAQLVRVLHRNRRAAGSIAVRGPIYSFISRNCCNKCIIN